MEVLCNGRVGDLLAELSGREVIELLGRYICSTFSFSRRTLRREAGLVLKKNVANLCRYTRGVQKVRGPTMKEHR